MAFINQRGVAAKAPCMMAPQTNRVFTTKYIPVVRKFYTVPPHYRLSSRRGAFP